MEYPASALRTPYLLNIYGVRVRLNKAGYKKILVWTNIAEAQSVRASACQAARGVAGSISLEDMPALWRTNVDVICVREAACAEAKGPGRFGEAKASVVAHLVATIPQRRSSR